jgi:hypothetical protein
MASIDEVAPRQNANKSTAQDIPSKMFGMDYSMGMRITPELFGAFLLCPSKWWLKANGECGAGNAYAEWVESQMDTFLIPRPQRMCE